ncbi:MAG: undecaprenyldiphospho-muramoylpentapeptide beta-N-acetylglucosaminyltransferase [Defluviitaleaceae bacterium]|nr:undecaprenyldiphospho-muramoylpentapeptide beta-N-acetylglucosaminyltransferase [Defluviitaleaceae bacterium]
MKKIVMTGGGTAGHVIPNIALFDSLKKDYKIYYIGSKTGIEKDLVEKLGIPYYGISSGKLRRYIDIKNFTDTFRVLKGFASAFRILKKIKPDVVFSKGGFVIVPVVLAAGLLNIPIILHESDITPGLANKISLPFAKAVCTSFPETENHIKNKRTHLTGSPIRAALFKGDADKGLSICGFDPQKPILLVMGGSQGAAKLNSALRESLGVLNKSYNIVHLCGKNNVDLDLKDRTGYVQFEYLDEELPHILALADIIVSRAGANSIFEFLALRKPHLLIPIPRTKSRGDQILNAESFKNQGFSKVLQEEELTSSSLVMEIIDLYSQKEKYIEAMENSQLKDSVSEIVRIIKRYS